LERVSRRFFSSSQMALEPAFSSATQVDWARACEREMVIKTSGASRSARIVASRGSQQMRLDLVAVRLTGSSLFLKDDRELPAYCRPKLDAGAADRVPLSHFTAGLAVGFDNK
jgi:hypothetical protein